MEDKSLAKAAICSYLEALHHSWKPFDGILPQALKTMVSAYVTNSILMKFAF